MAVILGLNLDSSEGGGWKPYIGLSAVAYPNLGESNRGNPVLLPDVPIPTDYLPSNTYRIRSYTLNCGVIPFYIPEVTEFDPFSSFISSGGGTSLIGASAGISSLEAYFASPTNFSSRNQFGYEFYTKSRAPQLGYCVGSQIKEQYYIRIDDEEVFREIFQLSRFKRMCVICGEIDRYYSQGGKHYLDIGINQDSPEGSFTVSDKINIIAVDGTKISVDILGILPNWDVEISDPGITKPRTGDFYQMGSVWYINDPYMLSGTWLGTEDYMLTEVDRTASSGFDLPVTSHNSPFEKCIILGVYVLKNKDTGDLVNGSAGVSMDDTGDYTWAFWGFNKAESVLREDQIYPDDIRYKRIPISQYDDGGATTTTTSTETLAEAEPEPVDFNAYVYIQRDTVNSIPSGKPTHLRIEIDKGGRNQRHNWHVPSLTGQYFYQNEKYFKILAHIEANIIDVSYVSVDGSSELSLDDDYSILNQYGWFISEHYMTNRTTSSSAGNGPMFLGKVLSTNANEGKTLVEIECYGHNRPTDVSIDYKQPLQKTEMPDNSFFYRFTNSFSSKDGRTVFNKTYGWRLANAVTLKQYFVLSVDFSNITFPENMDVPGRRELLPYKIRVLVSGDATGLSEEGTQAFLAFNQLYGPYTTGFEFGGGYTKPWTALEADISGRGCFSGMTYSDNYNLTIPVNARIGFCDGLYFGINDTISRSRYASTLSISVPAGARGLASLFNTVQWQDCVIYVDPLSHAMTMRRGSTHFTDIPIKTDIIVGDAPVADKATGIPLDLSELPDFKRLYRLTFNVKGVGEGEDGKEINAMLFTVGGKDNLFGFIIAADGLVNQQPSRALGYDRGDIPTDQFKYNGRPVSPVFLWHVAPNELVSVDMGLANDAGKVDVINGTINGLTAHVIKTNQLIRTDGYFDAFRTHEGQFMIVYGSRIYDQNAIFYCNGTKNDVSTWSDTDCVMVIGSKDDAWKFRAPYEDRMKRAKGVDVDSKKDKFRLPLMFLTGVQYQASILSDMTGMLFVVLKCRHDGQSYLGCYCVSSYDLIFKQALLCIYEGIEEDDPLVMRDFLWRPNIVTKEIMTGTDTSWTDEENLVKHMAIASDELSRRANDYFRRIMGPESVKPSIVYDSDPGIVSISLLSNGILVIFYDHVTGIRMLFSVDEGHTWLASDVTLVLDAAGAVLIPNGLLFITPDSGIEYMRVLTSDLEGLVRVALDKVEGKDTISMEETLEEQWRQKRESQSFLIGSGAITLQRISGYVTPDGFTRVFYYKDDVIVCMESTDNEEWSVTDNF